ncbi:MAG: type II secretion system F family protein [Deltaproteobacteria bacterium]|nr:type II secretion system F family protein [Deltaproteobacteria bacterium]
MLQKRGLRIVSLSQSGGQGSFEGQTRILGDFIYRDEKGSIQIRLGSQAPKTKHIIVFTKQLATMISSGVPLLQALGILAKQQESIAFRRTLAAVQTSIENGASMSASLAQHPHIFGALYVAMVAAGEASGNLDVILGKLVTYIEKAEKIKQQVKSAMAYPTIVVFVAFVVVAGLLVFVVPTFAQQYAESGRELPWVTQQVIDFSNAFVDNWYVIFGGLVAFIIAFRFWLKSERGRRIFDKYILDAPVIGSLLRKIAVGRFCSTMSSMLTSGVNLLEALNICAASSDNKTIENFVLSVRSALEKGKTFSEPLAEGHLFPEMVVSMVAVGETTGALDEMLGKVSDFYEEEVDLAVKTMLSMIEPIMIVLIGGIIAFIVIAMYLPIFEMAGGIS